MTATVQSSTIAEIEDAAEFLDLLAEYCGESAIKGMPSPAAKMETYRDLEKSGLIHVFSATQDGALIGFITILAPEMPHYSIPVAVSESFFVAQACRNTMAGLKLLVAAEAKARELGSPGLLVSAPFGGKLFELLPRAGYDECTRGFFKSFGVPAVRRSAIGPMSSASIEKVRLLEGEMAQEPQILIRTEQTLYAGIYMRTVYLPAPGRYTGALVKRPTILTVEGNVLIYLGDDAALHVTGYRELICAAGRKQAFRTFGPTRLTMSFATDAQTEAEAEAEFTDETELLLSRRMPSERSLECQA